MSCIVNKLSLAEQLLLTNLILRIIFATFLCIAERSSCADLLLMIILSCLTK